MEGRQAVAIRILNAEPIGYSDEARAILRSVGELVEDRVAQEQLAGRVSGFDALIVRLGLRVTRDVIESADRLRAVVTGTTGLDHVDVAACADRRVAVLSLKDETEFLQTVAATAEHTWALLLSLVRRIPWAFDSVRRGGWDRDAFRGRELAGRRLGILGFGRIGARVARYGRAFGMSVGAFDAGSPEVAADVARFTSLDGLLAWSDVLSVHLPLDDTTRGLLGRERLALLPRGALLLNTSRGAVLDEDALVGLLESGHLAGAALDVLCDEQSPARRAASPLMRYVEAHGNLLITPHLGGATSESMRRVEIVMAEKLQRFLTTSHAS